MARRIEQVEEIFHEVIHNATENPCVLRGGNALC